MKKIFLFCLISCLVLSLCACGSSKEGTFESNLKDSVQTGNTTNVEDAHDHNHTSDSIVSPDTEVITPNDVEELGYSTEVLADLKDKYIAEITIQDYGVVKIELDSTYAPITVSNFVTLVQDGFYDGLTFHRIMKGFMMQGGCPEGSGFGDSGTNIKGEFANNGVENNLSHTRGVVSMARSTDMNSASSQFFIMHADASYLDGAYAAFGKVISGMDIVDKICFDANPTDDNGTIPSEVQPIITSIKIIEE